MALFYAQNIQNGIIELDDDESRHLVKVLRKGPGDLIEVINGDGTIYKTIIERVDRKSVIARIQKSQLMEKNHKSHHIAIAPTKNADRLEWFIEKAVEIGIGGIHIIQTKRTERSKVNTERIRKIIISAMKQSRNIYFPEFSAETSLEEITRKQVKGEKYIAHLNNNSRYLKDLGTVPESSLLLIGPEGDFTMEEVELALAAGFKEVSLGTSILRTETAGVTGLVMLNCLN